MEARPSGPPEKPPLIPVGRSRWVLFFFVIALVLTFFAGYLVQRLFFGAHPKDSVAIINHALHSDPTASLLRMEFPSSKSIPQGPGLEEWLDGFPKTSQIQSIQARFDAVYAFDPNGDWDLQIDPIRKLATLNAPLPEFQTLQFTSGDIDIVANPALSSEETELAHRFIEEKLRRVLSQEEEDRAAERLADCRKKLFEFAQKMLSREGIGDYRIELTLAGDQPPREEP